MHRGWDGIVGGWEAHSKSIAVLAWFGFMPHPAIEGCEVGALI